MKRSSSLLSGILLTGSVAASVLPAYAASLHVAPKSVGLRLSDLPRGFSQTLGTAKSPAVIAKANQLSLSTVQKHGLIGSYEADFTHNVKAGVAFVASEPVLYKSAAGALWGYTSDVTHAVRKSGAHRLGSVAIGNGGIALSINQRSGKVLITVYDIAFHRGPWSVDVGIGGTANTFKFAEAIRYARIVDQRIQRGG